MGALKPSRFWWLRRPKYLAIFLREMSSLFILAYVLLYLQILSQLRTGDNSFVSQLGTPPSLFLSSLMVAFSLYHSITWFILLPKVQPIRLGNFVVKEKSALLLNILIFLAASLFLASLVYGVQIRTTSG